jgi:hypothetical protein
MAAAQKRKREAELDEADLEEAALKRKRARIAKKLREIDRMHVVADRNTGAPPLWSDLPVDIAKGIEHDVNLLSKKELVDYDKLRRKAQKYTQTLNERGRKVSKGACLDPDLLQIASARKNRKLVDVPIKERPRKIARDPASADGTAAPQTGSVNEGPVGGLGSSTAGSKGPAIIELSINPLGNPQSLQPSSLGCTAAGSGAEGVRCGHGLFANM